MFFLWRAPRRLVPGFLLPPAWRNEAAQRLIVPLWRVGGCLSVMAGIWCAGHSGDPVFYCCSVHSPCGFIPKGPRARAGRTIYTVLNCYVWVPCLSGAVVLPFCQVAGWRYWSYGRGSDLWMLARDLLIVSSPAGADGLHCQTEKTRAPYPKYSQWIGRLTMPELSGRGGPARRSLTAGA